MPDLSSLGPSAAAVIIVIVFVQFLSRTGTGLVESLDRVAKATEQAAREAKERNGHLAELTIQSKKDTMKAFAVLENNVKNQHIDNQLVDHQLVSSKE